MLSTIAAEDCWLYANLFTGLAYYVLTWHLLLFVFRSRTLVESMFAGNNQEKRNLAIMVVLVIVLFALFIALCGLTHTVNIIESSYGRTPWFRVVKTWVLVCCATISVITALSAFKVFPLIREVMNLFELSDQGTVQLADAVDSCRESIMVLDSDFIITRGNASTNFLFGPNCIGLSFLEVIYDPENVIKVQTVLSDLKQQDFDFDQGITVEYRAYGVAAEDEDSRWFESTLQKKRKKSSSVRDFEIVVMTRNIDERKKTEMYRSMLDTCKAEEQQRIYQAKQMYVTCVAHDLKTPLQSFNFALDLLQRTQLTEQQMELISNAQVSVDLMKLTVSQAMYISKVQSGGIVIPRKSSVSISNIIQRVKVVMSGMGAPVPIYFHVCEKLFDGIITDEEWLWQMTLNLLTNSCKYTDQGFIKVIWEEADHGSMSMLQCSVIDTGCGISENKISTIFDAFNQAQSGQMEGTGLGLFGLHSRVQALGGSCGVRNNDEYGRGSIFWFKIPYVKDTTATTMTANGDDDDDDGHWKPEISGSADSSSTVVSSIQQTFEQESSNMFIHSQSQSPEQESSLLQNNFAEAKSSTNSASIGSLSGDIRNRLSISSGALGLTAIVIDDVLSIRKLMTRVLLNLGFSSVDCHENGLRGLEAMKVKEVDIVFTDIQMPVLTGPEVSNIQHILRQFFFFALMGTILLLLYRWPHASVALKNKR